jgi:hypothetical protein
MSKKDKLKELIWITISKSGGDKIYISKLWKLLFYIESNFYLSYKEEITGVKYIKNFYGPTPDYKMAKEAIEELTSGGYIQNVLPKESGNCAYRIIKDYPVEILNNKQIESIQNTCEKFRLLNAKEISILSHNDPVYLMAEKINSVLDFKDTKYRTANDDDPIEEECLKIDPIVLDEESEERLKNFCLAF